MRPGPSSRSGRCSTASSPTPPPTSRTSAAELHPRTWAHLVCGRARCEPRGASPPAGVRQALPRRKVRVAPATARPVGRPG
eukprot:6672383-Alexandrium_andersonii.AAC.1